MLRVARMYVSTRAVAEEVVQETWLGVLSGIGRFEGRSSLKTWIFRILTNRAKTRGEREGRSLPFSSLGGDAEGERRRRPSTPTAFAADCGRGPRRRRAGRSCPRTGSSGKETIDVAQAAIDALPETPARGDHAARRRRLELRGGS